MIRITVLVTAALLQAGPLRAQINNTIPPPVTSPFPTMVSIDRLHMLRQTGPELLEEREVQLTIAVRGSTSLRGARLELRGNNLVLPIPSDSSSAFAAEFRYAKTFANSSELNAALPTGDYTIVSSDITPAVTLLITITAAAAPSVRVINFSALQAWDGEELQPQWTLLNTIHLLDFGLWRENGERLYTPPPDPGGFPGFFSLPAGTTSVTIRGVTAARGEIFTGRVTYGAVPAGPFFGSGISTRATLEFPIQRTPVPPTITTQPQAKSVLAGDDVSLSVTATGTSVGYQWRKDDTPISGGTDTALTVRSAQPADSGSYTVVVTNTGGSVTSDAAVVTISPRLSVPTIESGASAQTVTAGEKAGFSVNAIGPAPLTYQWLRNGDAVPGATQSTLTFEHPRPSDSGDYTVAVSNAAGTTTSAAARLKVLPVTRISNLSIRSVAGGDAGMLTLGLTISGGTAGELKPLLLRAIGPTLAVFGVDGTLADPQLALLTGSGVVAQNDDWAGSAQVRAAGDAVGAFALANDGSKDAALAHSPAAGGYTVQITGAGSSSGVTLAEIYDTTPSDTFVVSTPRLTNVSALTHVGTGADGLFAGFSISGATPKTVLVRGIGPTLAGFGLSAVLADPKLDLYQAGAATPTSTNDDWGAAPNATQIAAAAASVGAFALAADSRDAVLLVTLPPGSYSAQISGVNNTTGMALVEVYEVP